MIDFKNMNEREQLAVIGLALAIVFSFYFKLFLQPIQKKADFYKGQIKKMEFQVNQLEKPSPIVLGQKKRLMDLKRDIQKIAQETSKHEARVPSAENTSKLIDELTKAVPVGKLQSIRQKISPEEGFMKIFCEMNMLLSFKDAVEVLWKVERISEYIKIEEFSMNESKAKKKSSSVRADGPVPFRLVVSNLLSQSDTGGAELQMITEDEFVPVERNILQVKGGGEKVVIVKKNIGLKLEGITYNDSMAVAIINGNVCRPGDEVNGYTVSEVLKNAVVVADTSSRYQINISGGEAVYVE